MLENVNRIIVGVSGGPDSMFLQNFLIKKFGKQKIIIAHFNHNFRKESKEEEEFLRKYFKERSIEFISKTYRGKDFREANLRKERYNFFKEIGWGKYLLALGHNLTDRFETSILNISRGSGIKGFLNMKILDKNRKIYRPLLNLTKQEIQTQCDKLNIPYFIDKTNFDIEISKRNFIRNKIIPLLEELNPNFLQNFGKLYNQIEEIIPKFKLSEYLYEVGENKFLLKKLPSNNIEFFIRELLDYFGVYDFRSGVIKEIIDYILNAKGGGFKRYGKLIIQKKNNKIYFEVFDKNKK